MYDSQINDQIVSRLDLFESHAKAYSNKSRGNIYNDLEHLTQELLNAAYGWNLHNPNGSNSNTPAIDLYDDSKRIAVQVSMTANKTKINKTLATFKKKNLQRKYDDLYIIGVRSVSQLSDPLDWVHISTLKNSIDLDNLTAETKEEIADRISRSIPWEHYYNMSDRHCFEVVLSVLNRDAIRHSYDMEGNFDDMHHALGEIKQIATIGSIKGRTLVAKPQVDYKEDIYLEILEIIDVKVGLMRQIVSPQRRVGQHFLPSTEVEKLTEIRDELLAKVNLFCTENGLANQILPSGEMMNYMN
ncbi:MULTISPECIES: SMEK domain-containing protein [unclassified Rhodococcus (in: high G+C Gram-positive bacteria)]|uniref:SMEK domain-containing protein n=1 Tax=unclassified Rhodococcus (in: high G+C Gram-positive bacteria) TaxID=192944 RepID=UPI001AE32A50|nr:MULTISPECIES: SMEK domain-containing protein [unclassified Rhodococcus (in: high G+C Gram-positive bacteria)]MBP2524269.1 hypothetical protein [Rhodococcus sp. PvP104]MDA3637450.1 SMEK domain-containing protein [Rhodococcus sp. C-2]